MKIKAGVMGPVYHIYRIPAPVRQQPVLPAQPKPVREPVKVG